MCFLLLEGTKGLVLLVLGLEATVTHLGGGVDELEGDLLEGRAADLVDEGLAEGNGALLDTGAGALDHDEVLLDNTEVGEATERGDVLLGQVELSGGVGISASLTHAVDLLVDLSAVEVTVLTSAGDRPADTLGMPRANASDLAESLVGLARETASTPAGGDTLETLTLGDTNGVDHLVLLKDGLDGDLLLEEAIGELNLVGDVATVDLDLKDVRLLLAEVELADLGMRNDADDGAVLLDAGELAVDGGLALGISELLGVLGEGFLLGAVPVLIKMRGRKRMTKGRKISGTVGTRVSLFSTQFPNLCYVNLSKPWQRPFNFNRITGTVLEC